ncbi:NCS2 family permease [Aeromicrobium wangtongii]|uniref:NCS2 family permease n=1 Tax=Aeromicrobium wangtongii TaxID=2969247 RepID=A0ABY5M800_9ACTN|nr:NCS2 family permease [Aeromicrobium wangtongii]MCD9196778.1 NCS2 family permease [Aeromicrobium wangtongii]MCL3817745.1 NCS2 family permease [Aeromicrobium wangtongii]UUP14288.1 NCS2 family permease [Aeromicrobium wangtongii]
MTSTIEKYFQISQRGSTIAREVRGGVVTFLTMAYIIVLNPIILAGVADEEGKFLGGGTEPGSGFATIAVCTALVAGVLTILMGVVANFPLALAAGLGLNAFVAYSVATQMTWADAMGLVVLEGIIILVLVLTGFRKAVFDAVPAQLKTAIAVGIGLFITFIGLVDAGFIRTTGNASPPIGMGIGGNLAGWPVLVFCIGLLIMIALYSRGVPGAILIGIAVTTVIAGIVQWLADVPASGGDATSKGWNLNVPGWPENVVAKPDFSLLGEFSLFGSIERVGFVTAALLVFTLLLADFFDTMGTMTAIGSEAKLNDAEGTPPNAQRILVVDSVAAIAGGAGGVSSNTSYVESAAGVGDGARTGLASVVTGVLFLLSTFFAPLVEHIPNEAAVPALVLVGFLMMSQVKGIDWDDIEIAIPAFLTIVLMPFAYSITAGIGAGFIAYVLIKVVKGKIAALHPLMWIITAMFVLYFAIDPVSNWIS